VIPAKQSGATCRGHQDRAHRSARGRGRAAHAGCRSAPDDRRPRSAGHVAGRQLPPGRAGLPALPDGQGLGDGALPRIESPPAGRWAGARPLGGGPEPTEQDVAGAGSCRETIDSLVYESRLADSPRPRSLGLAAFLTPVEIDSSPLHGYTPWRTVISSAIGLSSASWWARGSS